MTGSELKSIRTRLGWTQKQLSMQVLRSVRTVIRWEGGRTAIPEQVAAYLRRIDA